MLFGVWPVAWRTSLSLMMASACAGKRTYQWPDNMLARYIQLISKWYSKRHDIHLLSGLAGWNTHLGSKAGKFVSYMLGWIEWYENLVKIFTSLGTYKKSLNSEEGGGSRRFFLMITNDNMYAIMHEYMPICYAETVKFGTDRKPRTWGTRWYMI
jgi:hypothetical protein